MWVCERMQAVEFAGALGEECVAGIDYIEEPLANIADLPDFCKSPRKLKCCV